MKTDNYNVYNIYLSGVGGQGIIKTSIIIGEAAMNNGLNLVMSEIHGMAQRGGAVSTQIRIGSVRSPLIEKGGADLLLAFEPLEALRSLKFIDKDTSIVTNTATIMPFNITASKVPYPKVSDILDILKSKSSQLYALNAEEIAKKAGHILSLNMVLLGAAAAMPGFPLEKKLLRESMYNNLPRKSMPINLKAFEEGYNYCSENI